MQIKLELLAPAKNKSIGIAAINCGADAVYIAGPKFGAREAAGNSISDIAELVLYAHKYGAKVYMVVNTILYDNELNEARKIIIEAHKIGCDAIIVQDLAIIKLDLPNITFFASTQTNIRTPQQAMFLESLGFKRLILARELSLQQIAAIKEATHTPLEAFIHGALCVSYSGQCYLSQKLVGRSANRGACAQACRSNYTLVDNVGTVIVKDSPILSLKDLNLTSSIPQLVEAGITSFKIEGRLKNESYIKNIVLHYRREIDKFITQNNSYCKASYGDCIGGFTPNPNATFNRGYTKLFIDSKRGKWKSTDGAKYLGEYIGNIIESHVAANGTVQFKYNSSIQIRNGDGLCFVTTKGEIFGARANSCQGNLVSTTERLSIPIKSKIYRNYNISFEKELEKNMPKRSIPVNLTFTNTPKGYAILANCADDFSFMYYINNIGEDASNTELAKKNIVAQLSKTSDIFCFKFKEFKYITPPFYPISTLNQMRRNIAEKLYNYIVKNKNSDNFIKTDTSTDKISILTPAFAGKALTYLANSSNLLSKELYSAYGAASIANAYELDEVPQAELMRTKYCIKYEYGFCPKENPKSVGKFIEPLFLINGKNKLQLIFDCKNCEMLVIG
ncbi:MAG: U32 family peptidase [Bacteroidales bacterium]